MKEYSLTRLLTIFINICHALAYAHARGVVLRDLKPANLMIGDFGEVYVMDWGLAKVLQRDAPEQPAGVIQSAPSFAWADEAANGSPSGSVQTGRVSDDDKTVDGTIMGTPLYMPPEQALGDIAAIDQRSDIYSLEAILYELLTLQPPIDKQGGHLAVLLRVSQGEIIPPQERDLQRTRAGKVPRELAAVATKALAKKQEDRYPTVEALRSDIERFLEGRSVSAKEDTRREMIWKFVKRNKGLSGGVAATLLVLLCSLFFISKSYLATGRAYAAYQREQGEKERRTKQAVPAFVGAARMWGENRNLDDALLQVNLALDYDPEYPPAHLLKGQVLIAQRDFASARAELDHYLKSRPADAEAKELSRLCQQAQPEDGERLLALAEVLLRQNVLGLSDCLMQEVSKLIRSREKLLPVLRKRIEASWPGLGNRLKVTNDGSIFLNFYNCGSQVRDLSPLRGMPLTSLNLSPCGQVRDLTPLQGMKLTWLDLGSCDRVRDLTPLQGSPLTFLSLYDCGQVRELTPLQGMKLTSLNLGNCGQVRDLTPLKDMPLDSLNLSYCGNVRDLTPLQGLPLTSLALPNSITDKDLTLLQSIQQLTSLHLESCGQVRDLRPLQGLRLTSLSFMACGEVHDLTPLQGMPLTSLNLIYCGKVKDLTPLKGLELREICLTPKYITKGMDILRQMTSLKTLSIDWGQKQRWPAAEFWKRYDAGEFNK